MINLSKGTMAKGYKGVTMTPSGRPSQAKKESKEVRQEQAFKANDQFIRERRERLAKQAKQRGRV